VYAGKESTEASKCQRAILVLHVTTSISFLLSLSLPAKNEARFGTGFESFA